MIIFSLIELFVTCLARDAEERKQWASALEDTILRHSHFQVRLLCILQSVSNLDYVSTVDQFSRGTARSHEFSNQGLFAIQEV